MKLLATKWFIILLVLVFSVGTNLFAGAGLSAQPAPETGDIHLVQITALNDSGVYYWKKKGLSKSSRPVY